MSEAAGEMRGMARAGPNGRLLGGRYLDREAPSPTPHHPLTGRRVGLVKPLTHGINILLRFFSIFFFLLLKYPALNSRVTSTEDWKQVLWAGLQMKSFIHPTTVELIQKDPTR